MYVQFMLQCSICGCLMRRMVHVDRIEIFLAEELDRIDCDDPHCSEARSFAPATPECMQVFSGPTILAREVGDDLYPMTAADVDWLLAPEDIPF